MSEEESNKLPRYEIQEVGDRRLNDRVMNHAILKRKTNGVLEDFMPNVGSFQNAKFIVEALKYRDDENRRAAEARDRDFQESLSKPHAFMQASSRLALCYCSRPSEDPIHIKDTDEDQI